MNWTYRQNSFSGGLMDADLMGRQDVENYYKGASRLENLNVTRQGCLSKRRGSRLVVGNITNAWSDATCRIIPIVYEWDDGYYLFYHGGYYSILHSTRGILLWGLNDDETVNRTDLDKREWATGTLTNAQRDRIYSVGSSAAAYQPRNMDYCQIGDVFYLAISTMRPIKVTVNYKQDVRVTATGTEIVPVLAWEYIDFGTEKYGGNKPSISTVTVSWHGEAGALTKTVHYRVSYVDTDGFESFASDKKAVTYALPWPEGGTITFKGYSISTSEAKANYAKMRIFKDEGSGFGYVGEYTDALESDNSFTFTDDYITPDLTETPRDEKSRHNFAKDASSYPYKVAMTNQRLVYARDKGDPFTIWMSCVGSFSDFSTHESVEASDAIDCTLAATEMPRIFHLLNGRELMVFTESGEWVIMPASGNALTPTTVSAKLQSSFGTREDVRPIMVGNEVCFTDSSGCKLLATAYDLTSDSYMVKDLSAMCHLGYAGIREIVYRESPDTQVYCRLADNTIGVLTYDKAQKMCAWSHLTFTQYNDAYTWKCRNLATNRSVRDGSTELVALMTYGTNDPGEVWAFSGENPLGSECDLADAVSMDGMRDISYTAGTTTYLPVDMMAVGKTTGTVFKSGSTSGTRAVITEDVIAGYPIEAHFESVYPDAKNGAGEMQGERMNATDVTVRVCNSSPFKVGQVEQLAASDREAGRAVTVKAPTATAPARVALQDGDVKTILAGSNGRDGRIRITSATPWPLNVMSIGVTYQVEGENLNGGGDGEG